MSGTRFLISNCHCTEDVTFKASYIISSNLRCKGRVNALFDLVVLGDVYADEIDVKGRFICTGHCVVEGAIVVQNDMWCEDVKAASIICHDRIVSQSIDVDTIYAEGSIIIGKTLAIEEKAQTNESVICGETVYGAGKIVAESVLTVEPLDLDDGEKALESPFQYTPNIKSEVILNVSNESSKYEKDNDYSSYISALMTNSDKALHKRLTKYLNVLKTVEVAMPSSISEFRDVALLIWLIEITQCDYFSGWNTLTEWTKAVLGHFQNIAEGKFLVSNQGRPADKLLKGYTISHAKYGIGVVEDIVSSRNWKMAVVNFEEFGVKKFPLPFSLKFFLILSETTASSGQKKKTLMTCEIYDYDEWLSALVVINENRERLGHILHDTIFELLTEKIGLKAKFIVDRFKDKGWS